MGGTKETDDNEGAMDIKDCVVSHSISPDGAVIPKTAADAYLYLLENSKHSDVTFIVGKEKKKMTCHSVFLMARSAVFEAALRCKLNGANPIEIAVNDVSPDLFESFLKFIYGDVLDIFLATATDPLLQLLELGLKYKVELLSEKCVSKLCNSDMTPEDAVKTLFAAENFKLKELRDSAIDQLVTSLGTLAKEPELLVKLEEPVVRCILERNDLPLKEVEVFNFLVEWGKARVEAPSNLQELRETLGPLLPLIRFPIMSPEEFGGSVASAGLLPSETLIQLFIYFTATGDARERAASSLEYSTKPRDRIKERIEAQPSFSSNEHHLEKKSAEVCEVPYLRECIRFTVNHPASSSVSPVKTRVMLSSVTLQWPQRLIHCQRMPNGFVSETEKSVALAGSLISDEKPDSPGPKRRTRRLCNRNPFYKVNWGPSMPITVMQNSNEATDPRVTNPSPSNEPSNTLQWPLFNFGPPKQTDSSGEAPVDKIENIFQTRPFSSASVNSLFRILLKQTVERPGSESVASIASMTTVFSANSLVMKEGETVSIEVNPPVELLDGKQNIIVLEEESFSGFSGDQYRCAAAGKLETSIAVRLRNRCLQISDIHRNDAKPFVGMANFFSDASVIKGMDLACSVDTANLRLIQNVKVLLYSDRKTK